jgi:hypothetical protein
LAPKRGLVISVMGSALCVGGLSSCLEEPVEAPLDTAIREDTDVETTDVKTELKYTPDWTGVLDLLDDRCAGCHGGPGADLKFPEALEADLASLEGRYVVPFSPESSTLWRVLSGELESGDFDAMPWGSGPLKERFVDHVRLWIEAGAPSPATAEDMQ